MTDSPTQPEPKCRYVQPPAFLLFLTGYLSGVLTIGVLDHGFGLNRHTLGLVFAALFAAFFLIAAQSANERNREALASHHTPPCNSTPTDHVKTGEAL